MWRKTILRIAPIAITFNTGFILFYKARDHRYLCREQRWGLLMQNILTNLRGIITISDLVNSDQFKTTNTEILETSFNCTHLTDVSDRTTPTTSA
jgi:hypothetical protein